MTSPIPEPARGLRIAVALAALLAMGQAAARGASPYLPLGLSPEIERSIERVMLLADKAVLTRPLAAATVLDALPAACEKDPVVCAEVRHYLDGLMKSYGLAHAGLALYGTSGDSVPLANRHGERSDSNYEVSAQAYWQPADNFLISGGFVAYEDEAVPLGSLASFGTQYVQFDIGFRDHWLSPLTGSAMLISTEAQTMPSITVSNYMPLTRWGFRYQLFIAQMSESSNIAYGDGFTTGNPSLAGVHISIEPAPGWSLGLNRLLQYGGGDRPGSFRDLVDAFLRPSQFDNTASGSRDEEFGNQTASITAAYLNQGRRPFSVYLEFAGEDTSKSKNYRLGNVSLSAGIHLPRVWRDVDLTLEASEWQNGWYAHGIYRDGMTHKGNVIGHWGGDLRGAGDQVGAQSLMARAGWRPRFGGWLEATYRWLDNASYWSYSYERAHFLELRYSRGWRDFQLGAELDAGKDVFGDSYGRLGTFIRF